MINYYSTPAAGLRNTRILGDAMDRAPHPYTAAELAGVTGLELTVAKAWLARNLTAERVTARRIPRICAAEEWGRPVWEYWRGRGSIMETWSEVEDMTEDTGKRIEGGLRPVSWRDGTRTSWSVDELGTVTAMKGSSVVRFGKMETMERTATGMRIVVKDGPVLTFTRRP